MDHGVSMEPRNTVERVADAGMKAIEAAAAAEGVELDRALLIVHIEGKPEDEPNAVTHCHMASDGDPSATTVLAFACSHVEQLARSVGIPLNMTIGLDALGFPER